MTTNNPKRKSAFVRAMARSSLLRVTVAWSMICGQVVLAAPQGAEVVHGQASISQQGDVTQITAGNNAIINYNSFNIASHETVQFVQPSATSRVLNRITGHDPTRIDGSLLANGRVYIVNPAGIYFGNGALVDVGGIFAAASNMTNSDFINNVNHFTDVTGSVVNYGTIKGDMVHLIGKHVANHGSILANGGLVSMVAGDDVLLGERDGHFMVKLTGAAGQIDNTAGVENTGTIDAAKGKVHLGAGDLYSLVLHDTSAVRGDQITVEGGEGSTVEVAGTLDASNTDAGQTGGAVHVLGDDVTVMGAQIDASGDAGGGEVLIGGDFQGSNDDIRNASRASVGSDVNINADALSNGNGGRVIVWSDGATDFAGSISARGGAQGGEGGFVEVSGKETLQFAGQVDLIAANGQHGTLLLDPGTITVVDPLLTEPDINGDGVTGDDLANTTDLEAPDNFGTTVDSVISSDAVEALLNTVDLILAATVSITINTDIVHDMPTLLILDAPLINLNAPIALTNGAALAGAGDTLTVNVGAAGTIVNGIDVAASGGIINVAGPRTLTTDWMADNVSLVFNGSVTLDESISIVTGGASIEFNDSVDGAQILTLDSGMATTTITGDVGVNTPLTGLDITADGLEIGASSINLANGSTVAIRPATEGQLIDLGGADTGGTLGLSNAELNTLQAPGADVISLLEIGFDMAGAISISTDISIDPLNTTTLKLVTGAEISGGGVLDANELSLTASSIGTSDDPLNLSVSTLDVTSTSDVYVVNNSALDLAASSVGGNLDVTVFNGTLTDSGPLVVDGTARFATITSGNDSSIIIDQLSAGDTVFVDISILAAATGPESSAVETEVDNSATITTTSGLDLGESSVIGDLIATASGGHLTDSGVITVGGAATFTTTGDNQHIELDGLGMMGSVSVNTQGVGSNAMIRQASELVLDSSNVTGDLTLIVDDLSFAVTAGMGSIVSGGMTAIEPFSDMLGINLGSVGMGLNLSADDLAKFDSTAGLRIGNTDTTGRITVSDTITFGTIGLFTKEGVDVALDETGTGRLNADKLAVHNTGAEGIDLNVNVNELAAHATGGGGILIDNSNTDELKITEVMGLTGLKTIDQKITVTTAGSLTFSADLGSGVDAVVSTGTGMASFIAAGAITDQGTAPLMIGDGMTGGEAEFITHGNDAGEAIILDNASSSFGAITAQSLGLGGVGVSDGNITIVESGDMNLALVETLGLGSFRSNGGAITDSGTLMIGGTARFVTRSSMGENITLNDPDSTFGAITAHTLDEDGGNQPTNVVSGNIEITEAHSMELASIQTAGAADLTGLEVDINGEVRGDQQIKIVADELNINPGGSLVSLDGGKLELLTRDNIQDIRIATGGLGGDYTLLLEEINRIQDGFSRITIGNPAGQHTITIGAVTFRDPVTIQAPAEGGEIFVNGQITGIGDASITLLGSGATTTLNADIITEGQDILIYDAVRLGERSSITLSTKGMSGNISEDLLVGLEDVESLPGNVTITGDVSDIGETPSSFLVVASNDISLHDVIITGSQTYTADRTTTLNSTYQSTGPGGITYTSSGGVILSDDTTVQTANGDITFKGTITGNYELELNAGNGSINLQQRVGDPANPIGSLNATAANNVTFGAAVDSNGSVVADTPGGSVHVHDIRVHNSGGDISLLANAALTGGNSGLQFPQSQITISSQLTTQGGTVTIGRDLAGVPSVATIVGRGSPNSTTPTNISVNTNGGIFRMGQNHKMVAGNISIATSGGNAFVGDIGATGTLGLNLGAGTLFVNLRNGGPILTANGGVRIDSGVDLVARSALSITAQSLIGLGTGNRPVLASPVRSINLATPGDFGQTSNVGNIFIDGSNVLDLFAGREDNAGPLTVFIPPQDSEVVAVPDEENLELSEKERLRMMGIPAEDLTAAQLLAIATGEGLPWLIDDIGSPEKEIGEHVVTVVRVLRQAVADALILYEQIYVGNVVDEQGNVIAATKSQRIREVLTQAWVDYSVSGAEADQIDFEQYLRTAPDTEEAWHYVVLLRALFDRLQIMGLTERELSHTKFVLLEREGIIPKGMTLPEFERVLFGPKKEVVSVPADEDLLSLRQDSQQN